MRANIPTLNRKPSTLTLGSRAWGLGLSIPKMPCPPITNHGFFIVREPNPKTEP